MQIAIAIITLVLCAGVLYWFKRSENQKRTRRTEEEEDERERLAQKTAQEFVNAKDLGEHCLYTIDGYIFAYIKIEGFALNCTAGRSRSAYAVNFLLPFSAIKRPYKSDAVSRPVDISAPLTGI